MGMTTIPGNEEADKFGEDDIDPKAAKSEEYYACKMRFRTSWEKDLESTMFDDWPYFEKVKRYCRAFFYE